MKWVEVKGLKEGFNYFGQTNNGVKLPDLGEEVLFCRPSYQNKKVDCYFNGVIEERVNGLVLYNKVTCSYDTLVDGIKWARFNKPNTENNIGYALAYKDVNGNNYLGNVPCMIEIVLEDKEIQTQHLKRFGCKQVTCFKFQKPCTYKYTWEYVNANRV